MNLNAYRILGKKVPFLKYWFHNFWISESTPGQIQALHRVDAFPGTSSQYNKLLSTKTFTQDERLDMMLLIWTLKCFTRKSKVYEKSNKIWGRKKPADIYQYSECRIPCMSCSKGFLCSQVTTDTVQLHNRGLDYWEKEKRLHEKKW